MRRHLRTEPRRGHRGGVPLGDPQNRLPVPLDHVALPARPPAPQMRQQRRRDPDELLALPTGALALSFAVEHPGIQIDPRAAGGALRFYAGAADHAGSTSHVSGYHHEPGEVPARPPIGSAEILLFPVAPRSQDQVRRFVPGQPALPRCRLGRQHDGHDAIVQPLAAMVIDGGPEILQLAARGAGGALGGVSAAIVAGHLVKSLGAPEGGQGAHPERGFIRRILVADVFRQNVSDGDLRRVARARGGRFCVLLGKVSG